MAYRLLSTHTGNRKMRPTCVGLVWIQLSNPLYENPMVDSQPKVVPEETA